ncbi:MAG: pyridoxal-phosphate dependent enzyme, partial [Candidatus Thorarchaeota archaeon]
MNYITIGAIRDAYHKIKGFVRKTPLIYSAYLSKLCHSEVYLKLENMQITNAFKIRGALN